MFYQPVGAEPNICVVHARNSNWLPLLLECQDRAEENNDPIAAYILGYMYQNGINVSKDSEISAKWYNLASSNGHAQAKLNLGIMLMKGQGVKNPDKVEGMLLISQAAELNLYPAISLLDRIKAHDLGNPLMYTYVLEDYLYILKDY